MGKWTAYILTSTDGNTGDPLLRLDLFESSRAVWVSYYKGRRISLIPRRPETILSDGLIYARALAGDSTLQSALAPEGFRASSFIDLNLNCTDDQYANVTAFAQHPYTMNGILTLVWFDGASVGKQLGAFVGWGGSVFVAGPLAKLTADRGRSDSKNSKITTEIGRAKELLLKAADPDLFDDQAGHIASAETVTVAGHVPNGVRNEVADP